MSWFFNVLQSEVVPQFSYIFHDLENHKKLQTFHSVEVPQLSLQDQTRHQVMHNEHDHHRNYGLLSVNCI